MNQTITAIMNRRSIRKFLPEQVCEEKLQAILEAGRAAPSGANNQTSHILVVQSPQKRQELIRLAVKRLAEMPYDDTTYKSLRSAIIRSQKGEWDFTYGAPTFIIVANKKGYSNNLVDSACVLENMMIAAQSLGVGTCFINNIKWLYEDEQMLAYLRSLGMEQDEIPCGGLSVGYSAMAALPLLKRTGNLVTRI